MTRAILVKAFLEGASMSTLAALLNEKPEDLEFGLRAGLQEIRDEAGGQPAQQAQSGAGSPPAAPAPLRNHAAAMKKSAVRRRIAAATDKTLDLAGYPAALQDLRATTQRAIYDQLKQAPQTIAQLAVATQIDSGKIFQGMQKLRDKNMVRGSEDTPVIWRLA
jgi:hypothetical protein